VKLVFLPFINADTGIPYLGSDVVTLVIKKPNGALLSSPPVPAFDTDVNLWTASIPFASFILGEWLVKATSNGAGTSSQNSVITWGDYVDSIPATKTDTTSIVGTLAAASPKIDAIHQISRGKWKIQGTQLLLYEADGTTVLQAFDLKDDAGNPSSARIFERDPA
jgi:hypothetical protein